MKLSNQLLAWLIMIYLALAWGSSFILMREALKYFTPDEVAVLRILIAAFCIIPFIIPHIGKLSRKQWITLFLVGLISNAIPAFLFPKAMEVVTSITAGMLNSLSPLFTLILGIAFFGFRFPKTKLIGVLVGFGGALLLIFFPANKGESSTQIVEQPFWLYVGFAMLIVLATACYATGTNLIKKYLNKMPAIWVAGFGLGLMIPFSMGYFFATDLPEAVLSGELFNKGLLFISILAILSTTIGVILYSKLVQITDPVFSSSVTYMVPVVAAIWGLIFGERINAFQISGSAIVLPGIYLVNKR